MKTRFLTLALTLALSCLVLSLALAVPSHISAQTAVKPETETDGEPSGVIDLSPMFDLQPAPSSPDMLPTTLPSFLRSIEEAAQVDSETASTILLPLISADMAQGSSERIIRMSGERARMNFVIDVPRFGEVEDFTITYRNSINVLPERSTLLMTVNGIAAEPVRLDAFDAYISLPLDADLLTGGRNEVLIEVAQTHRIYCGPEASFAIWTEIDLARSGAQLALSDLEPDAEGFLLALKAQLAQSGGVPVRLATGAADPAFVADLTTRLAGIADGGPAVPQIESAYDPAGPTAPYARITVLAEGNPSGTIRRGGDGALVLMLPAQVAGADTAFLLNQLLPMPGPQPDISALQPGAPVTLATLGQDDTEDHNRFIRHDLIFRLPVDWLVLASQKAELTLRYAFADALPEGSLLLVKINDTTVRLLPLDRNGGREQPPLDITFPGSLLHPGPNALSFEAVVPGDPPDMQCPAMDQPLLRILGASSLEVPPTPRMYVEDLSRTLQQLSPAGIQAAGAGTRSRAVAQALRSMYRPLEGQTDDAGITLTVVGPGGGQEASLATIGLSRQTVDVVLASASDDATDDMPAEATATDAGGMQQMRRNLSSTFGSVVEAVSTMAMPHAAPAEEWIAGRSGDAVLVNVRQPDANDALVLFVGQDTDPVRIASAVAQARIDPMGPRGQLAILTAEGDWQSWEPATAAPVLAEPLTLANFRFVAGNYASWAPLYFVVLLLSLTLLSVFVAIYFAISTRGGRKQ